MEEDGRSRMNSYNRLVAILVAFGSFVRICSLTRCHRCTIVISSSSSSCCTFAKDEILRRTATALLSSAARLVNQDGIHSLRCQPQGSQVMRLRQPTLLLRPMACTVLAVRSDLCLSRGPLKPMAES